MCRVNNWNNQKLNETINPKLRIKCKWDYRDKANKQGEVISDLKNAYRQNLSEVKSLQEKCESEEKILQDLIYDLRKELQETVQANVELKKNETQLKKDYARLSHEYNSCNSKYKALEKEMPSILRELEFFKQKSDDCDKEIILLAEKVKLKDSIINDITTQLETLKNEKTELSINLKDNIDLVSLYRYISSCYSYIPIPNLFIFSYLFLSYYSFRLLKNIEKKYYNLKLN